MKIQPIIKWAERLDLYFLIVQIPHSVHIHASPSHSSSLSAFPHTGPPQT